ncbi:zinc finger protein 462-like [Zophobas morio]|uniref:zinc finger protein 462-like n=1 Tax=Zophobas morio TaxID=2755281 RepID=UPI003082B99D
MSIQDKAKANLKKHIKNLHLNNEDVKWYKCNQCSFKTKYKISLNVHVGIKHLDEEKINCAKMEAYHCKDCDFKTEVTLVFEQHINEHHGPKRESREETSSEESTCEETSSDETSSEDSSIENYVGARYCFEPNLSLKSFEDTSASTGTEENLQSVSSLKESATHNSDFKQTDEIPLYKCAKCSYRSELKESLKHHIENSHASKQIHLDEQEAEWHKCQKCQFKSRAKGDLRQHINYIHLNDEDVKWFKCNKCDFKTKRGTALKSHVIVKHLDDSEIKWTACDDILLSHISLVHGGITRKLSLADHYLNFARLNFRNYQSQHVENLHNCKVYPYFSSSLFLMANHMRRHCFPQETFTCNNAKIEAHHCKDCDFKTELTVLFKQHIHKYHRLKKEYKDDLLCADFRIQTYACEKCNFKTNLSLKWLQHTSECTGTKENHQSVSSLKESATYNSNSEQTDEVRWFYCAKCSYKGKLKKHLTGHIWDSHSTKRHECDKCSYKCKRKTNLTRHINNLHLNHKDVKCYKCNHCYFKTKHEEALKRHVQVKHLYDDDAKIKCPNCSYRTKRASNLKSLVVYNHLNDEEIKWCKCENCSYKASLKISSEVNVVVNSKREMLSLSFMCSMASILERLNSDMPLKATCVPNDIL